MTTQTEALKALVHEMEYVLSCINEEKIPFDGDDFHEALRLGKEALAQEKALQALHDENERLGLYKNAYAEAERESKRLQCVTCGTVYADGVPPKVAQTKQEKERCVGCEACIDTACGRDECPKGWPKAAQPEQEPVAMKFKIYKPTVPDPMRQGINNALLPWVYDQDRSSGFDASMWVTPVATLPPQRTWVGLTFAEICECESEYANVFARNLEAKLKEKNQ